MSDLYNENENIIDSEITEEETVSAKSRNASGKNSRNRKHSNGLKTRIVKCVALAIIFGTVSGGTFTGVSYAGSHLGNSDTAVASTADSASTSATQTSLTATSTGNSTATTVTDVSDVVANVMPSIVSITCVSESEYYNLFGQSQAYDSESCGSGIIIAEDDDNLYIATNNHVVEGASSLTVAFSDDSTVSATVKGTDSSSDLAVVEVKKSDLTSDTLNTIKIATIGDSSELEVGQSAIAIGNALGYGQSVTTGVISALNREVTTTDSTSGTSVTNSLIQTDAAINPGNSGGALINMNGEVIGINSAKYTDTSVEGMGYAIPISDAQPILEKLINSEKVDASESACLGIGGIDVTSDISETYDIPEGVYVAQLSSNGAAETAGIVKGDVITAFDGTSVSSLTQLEELLSYYKAGTTVDVTIQHNENGTYTEETVSVTLGHNNSTSENNSENSTQNPMTGNTQNNQSMAF